MIRRTLLSLIAAVCLACPARAQASAAPSDGRPAATQFLLMVYETSATQRARTDAREAASYWGAFKAFGDSLGAAGVLRGGMVLQASGASRTVIRRGGKTTVTRGAHARSAEELGGYFIIEVATIDDAVRWAARVPAALTGAVEIRPSYPAPAMGR